MLELSEVELKETIRHPTSKRISENRVGNLAKKLVGLEAIVFWHFKNLSYDRRGWYNAQELIRLTNRREQVLEQLIKLAKPLPEYEILLSIPWYRRNNSYKRYLRIRGIRRFKSANQINAFIGIDLKHYESGDF